MANLNIIRLLCKERNLTLKDLALRVEITSNGLQHLLNENNTKVDTLEKIAKVLDVPVSIFFDEGTPAETRKKIRDLESALDHYKLMSEDSNHLIEVYRMLLALIDTELLPILHIDQMTESEIKVLSKVDNLRELIFAADSENLDHENAGKSFYIQALQEIIQKQNQKITELQNNQLSQSDNKLSS